MKRIIEVVVVVLAILATGICAQAASWKVKPGDTLGKISQKTGVSVKEIAAANNIRNIGFIRCNQVIVIPEKKITKKVEQIIVPAQIKKAQNNEAKAVEITEVRLVSLTSGATMHATRAESENFETSITKTANVIQASAQLIDQTTENLDKVKEQGAMASAQEKSQNVEENYQAKQKKTLLGKLGLSGKTKDGVNRFVELDATLGGWKALSMTDSQVKNNPYGTYALIEVEQWFGPEKPKVGLLEENYGIGFVAKGDYGWQGENIHWGDFMIAAQPAFWKNIDDFDFLLLKLRFGYRFNEKNDWHDKPEKGFTGGIYAEYNRIMSPLDMVTVSFDGWYFKNDSYAALPIRWEHQLAKAADWKINGGAALTGHWQKDNTAIGGGPVIGLKYNDVIAIGANAEFNKNGSYVGAFVTYMFNSDRHNPLAIRNRK